MPILTNEERQRFQNHLQIQLNQMSQGEPQSVVHQQPIRIQQQPRDQPIKLQKSFVDGNLDSVSDFPLLYFWICITNASHDKKF